MGRLGIRKTMAFILTTMLFFGLSSSVAADQIRKEIEVHYVPLKYDFDGTRMKPAEGENGFIYKGTTYVPLRFVAYSLTQAVEWEQKTYTVTIREPSRLEKVLIEEYKLNRVVKEGNDKKDDIVRGKAATKIAVYFQKVHYMIHGETKRPAEEQPGMIYKDTLYVPIRFLGEALNRNIEWEQETFTITIRSNTDADGKVKANPDSDAGIPAEKSGKDESPAISPRPNASTPSIPSSPSTGGGTSSGEGTGEKPSYDRLIREAEAEIAQLQSEAEQEFNQVVSEFKKSKEGRWIMEGQSLLQTYDAKFNQLMTRLSDRLTEHGYDSEVTDSYRTEYEKIKSQKMQEIMGELLRTS